jgi:hypothetical protein
MILARPAGPQRRVASGGSLRLFLCVQLHPLPPFSGASRPRSDFPRSRSPGLLAARDRPAGGAGPDNPIHTGFHSFELQKLTAPLTVQVNENAPGRLERDLRFCSTSEEDNLFAKEPETCLHPRTREKPTSSMGAFVAFPPTSCARLPVVHQCRRRVPNRIPIQSRLLASLRLSASVPKRRWSVASVITSPTVG